MEARHKGPVIDKVEGKEVIDCAVCKFKHVNPIPTPEELEKLYAKEFYSAKKPNYLKDSEEDIDWWMETYRNYFSLLKKHTKGRKLLDIGSGPGYFLKCGQEEGFDVTGIEPSSDAAKYSQKMGLKVVNDTFNSESAKTLGKFDIVTMNLVLEHIPDPKSFLGDIHKILKPSGLLFVLSPNDYSPFQRILNQNLGFKPWWVSPEQHLNYFDFDSISKLLKSSGFLPVGKTTTYPMEMFLLSGDNYIGKRTVGRKCHKKRKTFEMNLLKNNSELFNKFYQSLADNGLGREFVVISKKTDKNG